MKKVRWGVLSTAKIGTEKVIPAMQRGEHCEVTAIASRDLTRGTRSHAAVGHRASLWLVRRAVGRQGCGRDLQSATQPFARAVVDPALEAGKHVLVEKPIGLSAAEGQTLVDAAKEHPQLKVMEAFMYRHHPQWQRARQLVTGGAIGELRTIQSFFSYHNVDAKNIRNQAEIGGGGLADIGCYCVSLARFIFDAEPVRAIGLVEFDPEFGTDRLASALLEFDAGTSTFTCSTQLAPFQRVNIFGTEGRVEIDIPFNAPPDRPCTMRHQRDGKIEEIVLPVCDQYTIQGDLFALAVLNDTSVPTPIEDAVANMKVLEAIRISARAGTWV